MRRVFSLCAVSLLSIVHVLHSSSDLLHVLLTFRQVVDSQDQVRFGRKLDHPLPISLGSLYYCQESGMFDAWRCWSDTQWLCVGMMSTLSLPKSLLYSEAKLIWYNGLHTRVDILHLIKAKHSEGDRRTRDKSQGNS